MTTERSSAADSPAPASHSLQDTSRGTLIQADTHADNSAPWSRRSWLSTCLAALAGSAAVAAPAIASEALLDRALPDQVLLPRDHGSHPGLRTEWWYITGHSGMPTASTTAGRAKPRFGFQLTFFRTRVPGTQDLRSRFSAKQLVFAHAAVTDLASSKLLHDQRIARAGFGVADASVSDTDVVLSDWSLKRSNSNGSSRYAARMRGADFSLDLALAATQPVLLQGNKGLSRKGPAADNLSLYITEPQLAVTGSITLGRENFPISAPDARAWLDHEASEAILPNGAVGWDWIGMNLDDGSALTAFHLRRQDGSAVWAGGSWRNLGSAGASGTAATAASTCAAGAACATAQSFGAQEVIFKPLRAWTSPASGASYPVVWSVVTPVGSFEVHAMLDAQELDSRASTGAFYWEGLSELRAPSGVALGRGYLEMTGYATALQL